MIRLVSILLTALFIASCGGGGSGPVSISVPNPTNISVSTDVVANSFLSAIVDIAEDKQVDINEAYSAFQWVEDNPNFDPSTLANVNIVIDGETMTLEEGYYALKGFKKRYYDGKESLWSMAADQGQFDDESQEYIELEQIGAYDAELTSEEKLNLYKQQGQDQKVITKKTVEIISSSESVAQDPVILETVTQRTDTVTNDSGSITTNVYDVTTTVTTVTTITTVTKTPVTTHTWSDGTTTQTEGTATQTSTSVDESTQTVTETLVSTSTEHVIVSSTTVDEITNTTQTSDPVSQAVITTITETIQNDNGSTTINEYKVTTTTTTVTTTVTTTTTPVTTHTWSDGTTTEARGESVITSSSNDDVSQTVTQELISTSTNVVVVSSDTTDTVEQFTAITERTEVIENDNGSVTTNIYQVTTITTTTTPVTTHTWSDGTTTQEQGESTVTTSSSEELISTDTTVVLVSTAQDSVVETATTVSDPVITETTSTRTETISNADGSTTTNTYTTTVTTITTTTTVTITTTQRTTKTYSDGTVVVELGDPVVTAESTDAVETATNEVLTASVTTQPPTDYVTAEFEFSTGLGQINADAAYERGWTGAGVTVGLIDTGIDTEHTDFDQDKVTTIDFGYGTYDDHGHGTHVAGIMAASKNDEGVHGVAFDANIVSLKLCGSNGRCPGYYFDEAMLELSNNGVDIANLSANIYTQTYDEIVGAGIFYLEGQPSFDGVSDDTLLNYKQAVDNGMIIVNSAGNRGRAYPDKPSHYATRVDENGDLYLNGQWLIVGAVGSNNEIVSWSNRAGHICSNLEYTDGVATGCNDEYRIRDFFVVAPGSGIYSTAVTGGNMPMSGTSQAAPYVTGSLAILKQAWPQLQPEQLVGLITSTATDLGAEGVDDVYGHGLVDLDAATQPQGDIVAVQPSGNISQVSGGIVGDSTLSGLDEIASLSNFVVMDSYNRDYAMDMNSSTNFELVERSLAFSYQSYEGLQNMGNFAMSNDGTDIQYGDAINDTFDYTIGYMTQDQALFGSVFDGSLAIEKSSTQYIGIDAHKDFDNWYLLGSFTKGWSTVDAPNNSYLMDSKNIQSQSYYVGVGSTTTNTAVEFRVGTQLHITHGGFKYHVPTEYDWISNTTNFTSGSADATTKDIPYVAELDYKHNFTDNLSMNSGARYTTTRQDNIFSIQLGVQYEF